MTNVNSIEAIIEEIGQIINTINIKCLIVHADLMHSIPFVANTKKELLQRHISFLLDTFKCPIWISSYSYSVSETHYYDVISTPSEIGVLNEFFRQHIAQWRSLDPIFSYAGIGMKPKQNFSTLVIHPYGKESIFHCMNKEGHYLLQYGCGSGTQRKILYNITEAMSNVPYKQKVFFETEICQKDGKRSWHQSYYYIHPNYRESEKYRGDIFKELQDAGMAYSIKNKHAFIDIINIKDAISYLKDKIEKDPYYLLSNQYREWLQSQNY